jgi:7,8-dihydropterin-6-yl-methyl-4-(beta-D-ribofuranosyl)aminobenzene 5'-phosphate synthase
MRELSMALRTPRGLVLVAGCSHPGIEKIVAASGAIDKKVHCIFGGLHLVMTPEAELQRVAKALHDDWHVERIAPGHCTGEPGFAALSKIFGDRYDYIGLGDSIKFPSRVDDA